MIFAVGQHLSTIVLVDFKFIGFEIYDKLTKRNKLMQLTRSDRKLRTIAVSARALHTSRTRREKPQFSTISSYSARVNPEHQDLHLSISYCKQDDAQQYLVQTFREELNDFILQRIMSTTKRKQQPLRITRKIDLQKPFQKQRHRVWPRSYRSCKLAELLNATPQKLQKVIAQPILLNCREKLMRIIQKKQQQEHKFAQLRRKIGDKIKSGQKSILSRSPDAQDQQMRQKSEVMRRTIEVDKVNKTARYWNRLQDIHRRRQP